MEGVPLLLYVPEKTNKFTLTSFHLSETKKDADTICRKLVETICKSVAQVHLLSLSDVILLQPMTVHKTTSGKIARA